MSLTIFEAPTIVPSASTNRRDRERYFDQASIFALSRGFVVLDALTIFDASQYFRLFIRLASRNENRDWLADNFFVLCSRTFAPRPDSRW